MERWEAKLVGLIVTLIIPFVMTILPYWVSPWILSKGAKGERVMCYLMCFGGGIFFGTFLLHMAPEVREILDTTLLIPNEIAYPLTDLIIGLGFFFVLYLEKIVMRINKRRVQRKTLKKQQNCIVYQNQHHHLCSGCREGKQCLGSTNEALQGDNGEFVLTSRIAIQVKEIEEAGTVSLTSFHATDDCNNLPIEEKPSSADTEKHDLANKQDVSSIDSHSLHEHAGGASHHDVRSLVLIVALSMHHIFEGLSLGLQTTVQRVFTLLVALMCHEIIISFSLGLQFVKCKYSLRRMLVTSACCSIIMPIGVAIGMIMSEVGATSTALDMANGILQAFACGTFIFVTFFEILQEEINPHDTSIGKVTGAAIGFTVMALMTLIPEGSDEEETHAETTVDTILQNITVAYTTYYL